MTDAFNPGDYWEARHAELQGDHRNVGNRGLTSEQNLNLIASKAALVCHRLGALGLKAGASVLDAGCGSGTFTSMLAPIGFQLFGCDISPTAIDAARELGIGEFNVSSLAKVGFDRTFDAVLCLDVLFHVVDDAQWHASVTGLYHATRPGGYFFVVEHFPKPGSKQATHCRWRSLDDYEGALKGANWIEVLGYQYPQQRVPKTLMIVQRPEGA
ncbi:hypothetical protein CSC94_04875 [Zhengella mangrovi]|uniref:Methyltransferase domain-containing protein n=1 Tax=Zhengella mangrovi TaxID=1982044 RepID=A0A2G1QRC4_9HYPH|nr:class I SAM-dependent methyltransferase [Zhengella mangrovi]PHP68004.1 hypothetical protein CSC94_04875 [Zhengella mangrovi]